MRRINGKSSWRRFSLTKKKEDVEDGTGGTWGYLAVSKGAGDTTLVDGTAATTVTALHPGKFKVFDCLAKGGSKTKIALTPGTSVLVLAYDC